MSAPEAPLPANYVAARDALTACLVADEPLELAAAAHVVTVWDPVLRATLIHGRAVRRYGELARELGEKPLVPHGRVWNVVAHAITRHANRWSRFRGGRYVAARLISPDVQAEVRDIAFHEWHETGRAAKAVDRYVQGRGEDFYSEAKEGGTP